MSINRFRQILQSNLRVYVDSSLQTVTAVEDRIAKRTQELTAKGNALDCKTPSTVAAFQNLPEFSLHPVDLLRKIGQLTTPSSLNMARFSASWATRRYFWAIQPGTGLFRLSSDARQLDRHQKTLLSDEFGMGMAGLVMERFFQADGFSDISAALADPLLGLQHEGEPEPDYLMWNGSTDSYYVVECKGTQTSRAEALHQLRRGMEQVPTVTFRDTNRSMTSLVIATFLGNASTTILILDPPDDEREFKGESISKRVTSRKWQVETEERLSERVSKLQHSYLLKWSGQNQSAARIDEQLEVQRVPSGELTNAVTQERTVRGVPFVGYRLPLFPELFHGAVTVFSGIQGDIFEAAQRGTPEVRQTIQAFRTRETATAPPVEAYASIGIDGTCLQIEGV